MTKEKVVLLPDEFIPMKTIKSFWMMPKAIVENEHLSLGAKMLYAVLAGLAGKKGTSWPSKNYLSKRLGNPSLTTLYRWQDELIDMHLLRVRQKGRGISNNYYFIKNSLIPESNPTESGQRLYAVKDLTTGNRVLKNHQECMAEYVLAMEDWRANSKNEISSFPKPHWPLNREDAKELKEWYGGTNEAQNTQKEKPIRNTEPENFGEKMLMGLVEEMSNR